MKHLRHTSFKTIFIMCVSELWVMSETWLSISVLLHKLLKLFNPIQFADMAEKYVCLTEIAAIFFFLKKEYRQKSVMQLVFSTKYQ